MTANPALDASSVQLEPEALRVVAPDGASAQLAVYACARPEAPVVLCLPALGITAGYYAAFAEQLRGHGLNAATMEFRGHGTSSVRASWGADFDYATLEADLALTLSQLRKRLPDAPVFLLGHSLGGQISALHLATRPEHGVRGLAIVASGAPWFRFWPRPIRYGTWSLGAFLPLIARVRGHLPGQRLGFAGREARGVIADWGYVVRTGRLRMRGISIPALYEALRGVRLPLLSVTIDGDNLTPLATTEHMVAALPNAAVERFHYDHRAFDAPAVDHIRWPRHAHAIADCVAKWVAARQGEAA